MNVIELNSLLKSKKDTMNLSNNNYISEKEILNILNYLDYINEDFLITPFLLTDDERVLELNYVELNIVFKDENKIYYFSDESCFSNQFKQKFSPKLVVDRNNKTFLKEYLEKYFINLREFDLKKEFNITIDGELYFEIY